VSYPPEFWELLEVVMAGAPKAAVKGFRKSMIGRGKPLKAREADAAIRGAILSLQQSRAGARADLQGIVEPLDQNLERLRWYLKMKLPVVFARPAGWQYTRNEKWIIEDAREQNVEVTFLEFDDNAVDRVNGPA